MRGNELLDKMGLIDPAYIEEADRAPVKKRIYWTRWAAMAACFCLIIGAIHLLPHWQNNPGPEPSVPGPDVTTAGNEEQDIHMSATDVLTDWFYEYIGMGELVYNEAASMVSADRAYIPGYFTKELEDNEIAAVVSEKVMANANISGYAGFDGTGTLLNVILEIKVSFMDHTASLIFRKGELDSCYVLLEEPTECVCNGMDLTVYQWTGDEKEYMLDAYGQINDWSIQIVSTVSADELERGKRDFETLVRCLTDFGNKEPDFSAIVAEEIPEFFVKKLNLIEAQKDMIFGAYMPQEIPEGFAEESIRRYKDQTQDYLSGLWTKGLAEISWIVSKFDEQDAKRLTSVAETENYDLSLYPIPRAESVPEELHEIVNCPIFIAEELTLDAVYKRAYKVDDVGDVDGWRMMFAVKYGDVVIELRTKGVELEWVFQQLKNIVDN